MFDFLYFDTEQQNIGNISLNFPEPYIYFFHMIIKGCVILIKLQQNIRLWRPDFSKYLATPSFLRKNFIVKFP